MSLQDTRIVILGGTSGLGFATAQAAAREGARVSLVRELLGSAPNLEIVGHDRPVRHGDEELLARTSLHEDLRAEHCLPGRDVEFVDLPTGHWPQFTKPKELAEAILAAIDRT